MKYTNPILPGFHPDPSICRRGEDFFLVTSSFEYFPGVPLFHSRNLVDWTQIGHCLTRPSQLPLDGVGISGGIFAPTLRVHEDRFYLVTTNLTHGGHFYVWTDDPFGEWSDPVWIEAEGIDPDLFWDDNGRVIFSSTGKEQVVLQREIDLSTGQITSEPHKVPAQCGGKYPEAPHLYKRKEWFYLMLAEGGTEYGHCVSIARGPSSLGPWESCPHNPILTHRSTDLPIQATGHADLVEDSNGHWWMVCLGIRVKGFHPCHVLGRETFLAPVTWVNDWPVVNGQGRIGFEMEGHPGLPIQNPEKPSIRDDFTGPSLAPHWNFIGNPDETVFGIENGQLRLRCAAPDLDTMGGQAWVGRRQQHFNFRAGCLLDFEPSSPDEEAGLTVFQNIHHHYEIAVAMDNGVRTLLVRKRIGSLQSITAQLPAPAGPLHLFIEGSTSRYRLGYLNAHDEASVLDEGECRYLSTEVGGKFTGVYLAMYATAHNTRSTNEASFEWFDYDPTPET